MEFLDKLNDCLHGYCTLYILRTFKTMYWISHSDMLVLTVGFHLGFIRSLTETSANMEMLISPFFKFDSVFTLPPALLKLT